MFAKATIATAVCVGAAFGGAVPAVPAYAAVAAPVIPYAAAPAFPYAAAHFRGGPLAVPLAAPAPRYVAAAAVPAAYAAAPALSYGPVGASVPLKVAAAAPVTFATARYAPALAGPVAKVAAIAEPVYAPQPYQFGYESIDEYGTKQSRQETSDGQNAKSGSYGFTDARGVFRQVNYVADAAGFRASISTNEPGTAPSAPAAALYNAAGPAKAVVAPVIAKPALAVPAPVKFL